MRTIIGLTLAGFLVAHQPPTATIAVSAGGTTAPPVAVAKSDPKPALDGADAVDGTGEQVTVKLALDAYDLATSNKLVAVTVILIPADHGQPTSAEGLLASSYPRGSFDTSAMQAGGKFTVAVDNVPDGQTVGAVLFTYDV